MPLNADQLQTLMMELGPASPNIQEVVTNEAGDWGLLLDDATQIHLSLRDAPARVELATIVGMLPAKAPEAAEAASMLLMFNLLSHETGGARMALSPAESHVFLMIDLPESSVDLPDLQSALRDFAELADTWRTFLKNACQGVAMDEMPGPLMQPV